MNTRVCPFNGKLGDTKNLIFSDVGVREGEQSPGVIFTKKEKIEIFRRMGEVGVRQAQLYPGKTKESKAVAKEIAGLDLPIDVIVTSLGFEDGWKENIDFALECGTKAIHTSVYVTPYTAHHWDENTVSKTIDRIYEMGEYIKNQCKLPIEIGFIDATRADETVLLKIAEAALKAGMNRMVVADTVGAATPEGYYHLVSRMVQLAKPYGAGITTHTHNDFGLALANTFAGIKAGATIVDTAVNGIGDRAGNACLAEIVVGLKALYGMECPVNEEKMVELAQYVSKACGRPIPTNQPLVGDLVFANQDDFHVEIQLTEPLAFRAMIPEEIGAENKVLFGKLTGPATIEYMAKKCKRDIPKEYYMAIREAVYRKAEELPKGLYVDEHDFWEIVNKIVP